MFRSAITLERLFLLLSIASSFVDIAVERHREPPLDPQLEWVKMQLHGGVARNVQGAVRSIVHANSLRALFSTTPDSARWHRGNGCKNGPGPKNRIAPRYH